MERSYFKKVTGQPVSRLMRHYFCFEGPEGRMESSSGLKPEPGGRGVRCPVTRSFFDPWDRWERWLRWRAQTKAVRNLWLAIFERFFNHIEPRRSRDKSSPGTSPRSAVACHRLRKGVKTEVGRKLPHPKGFASDKRYAALIGTLALPSSRFVAKKQKVCGIGRGARQSAIAISWGTEAKMAQRTSRAFFLPRNPDILSCYDLARREPITGRLEPETCNYSLPFFNNFVYYWRFL